MNALALFGWVALCLCLVGCGAVTVGEGSAPIDLDESLGIDFHSLDGYQNDYYRLYDGITAYVVNEGGRDFDVTLDLRDLNMFERGPREVLFKVYAPDGTVMVRELIEDDGMASTSYLPRFGGWDHEMWYYGLNWTRGTVPMIRWSTFSDPTRLVTIPRRSFTRRIAGKGRGVYRVMVVGGRDHYATIKLSPKLKYAVCGHALWLHGHGDQFRKSYIYVPRGTRGLHLGLIEFDPPQTRRFTLKDPDGKVLFDTPATGGFAQPKVSFEAGVYDNKLLTLEVSEGPGDFMLHILINSGPRNPDAVGKKYHRSGGGGSAALLAPDRETALAARGGTILHDGREFWHAWQIKLYDWLQAKKPEDFTPLDADGNVREMVAPVRWKAAGGVKGLATVPGFVPLNGAHEPPPLCDTIMHNFPAHKDPQVLNMAIEDMFDGLMFIGTGDHRFVPAWNGNFGYMFATYAYHYWRPAWRMLHTDEVPAEVKDAIRAAFIDLGDRLYGGWNIERANGNAFSHVPIALRYCAAATEDPLHQKMFKTYFDRWANEGWGTGAGISRSGDSQEHFAHAYHYGTYIIANLKAVVADFADPEFLAIRERILNLYNYVWCPERPANVWSARTGHNVGRQAPWQGKGGPDVTVSVNDGEEWFAARRASYYVVTFHGRLAPMWQNNYFGSRLGYGGGCITQMAVPGRGPVIVSTLSGSYGKNMEPHNWRNFMIHSIVGTMADGGPLVVGDSEHGTGTLDGNVVTSAGEVRDCPVKSERRYEFADDHVKVGVKLAHTDYINVMWGMGRKSRINEAYEMIPFIPWQLTADGKKADAPTVVTADGDVALGEAPVTTKTVTIDRGGFGVRIEFDAPMPVLRGQNGTVLIQLIDKPSDAKDIALDYRLVPFGAQ